MENPSGRRCGTFEVYPRACGATWAHEYQPAFDWDGDVTPEVADYNTQYG